VPEDRLTRCRWSTIGKLSAMWSSPRSNSVRGNFTNALRPLTAAHGIHANPYQGIRFPRLGACLAERVAVLRFSHRVGPYAPDRLGVPFS